MSEPKNQNKYLFSDRIDVTLSSRSWWKMQTNIINPPQTSFWKTSFIAQDEGGRWVTISGRHVFIGDEERASPVTSDKLRKEDMVGFTNVYRSKGVSASSAKTLVKRLKEMPEGFLGRARFIELYSAKEGEPFDAGGQNFKTAAEWVASERTIRIYGSQGRFPDEQTLYHEVGHSIWGGKFEGGGDFARSTNKEGYVSEYAKSWGKEHISHGISENFAEVTSITMYPSGRKRLAKEYPETYKSWVNIAKQYGWSE